MGVGATDEFNFGEDARIVFVDCLEKKPGNSRGFGGGTLRDDIAFYRASVKISPAGASAVDPHFGTGCVEEGGVGGLKDPLRGVRNQLTRVDLNTLAGDGKDGVLRGRRIGGILGLCGRRDRQGH